jgi:hypothetical protein
MKSRDSVSAFQSALGASMPPGRRHPIPTIANGSAALGTVPIPGYVEFYAKVSLPMARPSVSNSDHEMVRWSVQ